VHKLIVLICAPHKLIQLICAPHGILACALKLTTGVVKSALLAKKCCFACSTTVFSDFGQITQGAAKSALFALLVVQKLEELQAIYDEL